MRTELFVLICGAAVVLSGLVAGVFMAFSDFVMKSLAAATPAAGIESMQIINRKVYGSVFLVLLLGMAPVSLGIAVYAIFAVSGPASGWLIAGGTIYVTGVFVVTIACNVPMNKRLDAMDLNVPGTESYWASYASSWTRWNHVRSATSAASAICYLLACILLSQT
jgi:uncharacterized membrane protein